MASLQDITLIVIAYAKQTSRFTTPTNIMDPIVPSPQSLGPDVFSDFYFELLNALTEGGITAKIPFDGLKACRIWRDVAMLVLHFQEA